MLAGWPRRVSFSGQRDEQLRLEVLGEPILVLIATPISTYASSATAKALGTETIDLSGGLTRH